jgi:hypothetical protein
MGVEKGECDETNKRAGKKAGLASGHGGGEEKRVGNEGGARARKGVRRGYTD